MTLCSSCGERRPLHRHDLCAECDDTLSEGPPRTYAGSLLERDELERRRSWQGYYDAGLPWTGEFEDAVNRGEVDVS